jgi:hypothetical protein
MIFLRFILAVVLLGCMPKAFAGAPYEIHFATGPEGWTAGDGSGAPLLWANNGGNPGGRIYFAGTDTARTVSAQSTSFLGGYGLGLGLGLTFQLKGDAGGFKATIIGSENSLVRTEVEATNFPDGWTYYYIPLYGNGWHIDSLDGPVATDAQVYGIGTGGVLRFDFQLSGASPGVSIDNVGLIPEPATWATLAAGLLFLVAVATRRRSP